MGLIKNHQAKEVQKPPGNRHRGAPKGSKNAEKHGYYRRKVMLKDVALLNISRQTALGRAITAKADAIFADRGGKETFSELQRDIVNRYLITELQIQGIDRWLLEQPSLINKSRRMIYPIVNER